MKRSRHLKQTTAILLTIIMCLCPMNSLYASSSPEPAQTPTPIQATHQTLASTQTPTPYQVTDQTIESDQTPASAQGTDQTSVPTQDSQTSASNQNYIGNKGDLAESPFTALPLGSVQAREWLENQLLLMKNGLTGHMSLFNEYNSATSMWLGSPSGENWERGPYYMRGLVALAYQLDDPDLKTEARQWIDWSINSQRADGFFGPSENSWWSRMPVLMAIRDYYEVTEMKGNPDTRVIPFMEKYFRYQAANLPARPLTNWADARGGDNIDSVLWLYDRIYDPANPDAAKWLLDLAALLLSQTNNWTDWYNTTTVRQHVVNISQGAKLAPVYYQVDQQEKYYTALKNGLLNMSIDHGRIDELPNADEASRDNQSVRGTETCGVVEALLSTEIAERIFGEAWLGDRIEKLAYNALPATTTSDHSGHTYYILQNQVIATMGRHGFVNDHGDSAAFGAPNGFDCCFANYHMGWPKFVQSMWMATGDNGLALTAYGPNSVTAKVADGKTAKFLQETDYPFKDDIKLTYGGEKAAFGLRLRIPAWAKGAIVKVNGAPMAGVTTDSYYKVDREWNYGDTVELNFPSEIETSTWYNDSVGVEKGALIYGLKIGEDWRLEPSNAARELKKEQKADFPSREIFPTTPWNYGLIVNYNDVKSSFQVITQDKVPLQPFSPETAPVVLKAKGQLLPDWVLDGNKAGPVPFGPTKYDAGMVSDIELIPYGSGKLRISHFPKIGDAQDDITRTAAQDGKTIEHNGKNYLEFKNVVVPKAEDYTLEIYGNGAGSVLINNKYSAAISFTDGKAMITNLKSKLSGDFRFDAGQYNNLRFDTTLNIEKITVIPVNRTITDVQIISAARSGETLKIITNLDPQETPFKVIYGTTPGVYTSTARFSDTSAAVISGTDSSKTYYAKVVAGIKGVMKESDELIFEPQEAGGGLKPNPNVPVAAYSGFTTLNYMPDQWKLYDPENKINIMESNSGLALSQINFGSGTQVKAALNIQGAENWVDYAVESVISLDSVSNNNAGIFFRTTNIGDGPDAYNGYYAGIGRADGRTAFIIGYADGGWHTMDSISMAINPGQKYTLKVVTYGENIAVYLDGVLIKKFTDTRFARGTVGLRSYTEAFKAYNLTVRAVTESDLTIFQDGTVVGPLPPDYTQPNFADNFENAAVSNTLWTKYGTTSQINIAGGSINLGSNTNVKATAGSDSWTDYVYEADVTLGSGSGNGGLIFRSSREGSGADTYYGYYFGIANDHFEIGKASNGWTEIYRNDIALKSGANRLKVVVYNDLMIFYINGNMVANVKDATHKAGKIGVRGYNKTFSVDNVLVRPLTPEEFDLISNPIVMPLEATVSTCFDCAQFAFPRVGNATSYEVLFGRESGVYTGSFGNYTANNYAGDKLAFSLPGSGTFYVRLAALNGNDRVGLSEEFVINTGYTKDVTEDKAKLSELETSAADMEVSGWTVVSSRRLAEARDYASAVRTETKSNQMNVAIAMALLRVAMANQYSEDLNYSDLETAFDLSRSGDSVNAVFDVKNGTDQAVKLACIIAVYKPSGALAHYEVSEQMFAAHSTEVLTLSKPFPVGYTAKAFLWKDYVPVSKEVVL